MNPINLKVAKSLAIRITKIKTLIKECEPLMKALGKIGGTPKKAAKKIVAKSAKKSPKKVVIKKATKKIVKKTAQKANPVKKTMAPIKRSSASEKKRIKAMQLPPEMEQELPPENDLAQEL